MPFRKMPFARYKRIPYRKNYRKKTVKAKAATASFNTKVRRVISRSSERKLKVFNLINTGNIKGSGVKFTDATKINHSGIVVAPLSLMALDQGTAQDNRIGNKISNVYLNVRGFAHSLSYNAVTNPSSFPYELHILAYKNKHDRSGDFTRLKQELNNSLGEITGSAMSTLRIWNKDEYIIKMHKVMKFNALAEVISEGNSLLNPQSGQNPIMRRFSFRVPVAKNLVFRDDENVPQNDWVHLAVYVCDGSGDELSYSVERCQIQMDAYLSWNDN